MAYVFTVETGAIVTGANSYVTVQEADDQLTTNIHAGPIWLALDTDVKEKLLSWASRYLDERARWNGRVVSATQPMRWPRYGVYNSDNILIADDVIPPQLKAAVIEMARYLITNDRSTERDQDGLKSIKVDVIELVFNTNYTLPEVPNEINLILTNLGYIISGYGAAKIRRS